MLAKWLRRWFGSVRLFMTLMACLIGFVVVFLDTWKNLRLSTQLYGYLVAILGSVAVFVFKDTDRPSGYNAKGYTYESEKEGEP